jgi:hypothetical protein
MTDTVEPTDPPDAESDFARLAEELAELGFEPHDAGPAVTYTATDSTVTIAIDRSVRPHHAVVTNPNGHGPGWQIGCTATTPAEVQLVILYAALNATDITVGLNAVTAALTGTQS